MDEKLLCGICKKLYEEPRLLSCLHSFCTNCLIVKKISGMSSRQISLQDDVDSSGSGYESEGSMCDYPKKTLTQKIICPTCEQDTILNKGGVRSLPVNFLLEKRSILQQNKLPPCELCSSSSACSKCEQCNILMCALCMDSHLKFGDTAEHVLVQLNSRPIYNNRFKCKVHIQELNYYCCTCTEVICFTCCTTTHASHKYETATRAAENCSATLVQAVEKAKPVIKESEKSIEFVKLMDNKITSRCSDVEREIDGFMQAYKEALDEHGQALIQELQMIKNNRLQLLWRQRKYLDQKSQNIQNAVDLAEDLLSGSSPLELLNIAGSLFNWLEVGTEPEMQSLKVSDCVQFLPEEKSSTIGKYQLFGILSTQTISPEHCTLETEGLLSCRQHKKSCFRLTVKDCENKVLGHGGEKIIAELRYKDATQRAVSVTVNDEGDGNYVLSFIPDSSGDLSLTVTIRNQSIQGSPFKVSVSLLRPHKGVYHCCTFCSSGGNKSVTCGCPCKMPGYNGCGHGHLGHPGRRHWSCCGNILQNSECSRPNQFSF